jgi:hypothetical protein
LLHFVVITLGLSALNNCKSIVYHLFEFEHEDVLTVLNDVIVESLLGLTVSSKQDGNRDQKSFFLDIEFLLIGNEIANQSDSPQIIKHGLLLLDLHREVHPVF